MHRWRRWLASVGFVAGCIASVDAIADSETLSAMIANKVESTSSDGVVITLMLQADGSLKSIGPDGSEGAGTWTEKDGQFCTSVPGADGIAIESCGVLPAGKKLGDSWQQEINANGESQASTVSIVAKDQ